MKVNIYNQLKGFRKEILFYFPHKGLLKLKILYIIFLVISGMCYFCLSQICVRKLFANVYFRLF
ncbi:MAG: hypothetical protein CMP77_09160 [Flavobacterium sp.]|nr:hypothetical protein [Flavobacterium sp.]